MRVNYLLFIQYLGVCFYCCANTIHLNAQQTLKIPSTEQEIIARMSYPNLFYLEEDGFTPNKIQRNICYYPFHKGQQLISIYETVPNPEFYRNRIPRIPIHPFSDYAPQNYHYHYFVVREQSGKISKVYGTGDFDKSCLESPNSAPISAYEYTDADTAIINKQIPYKHPFTPYSGSDVIGMSNYLWKKQAGFFIVCITSPNAPQNKSTPYPVLSTKGYFKFGALSISGEVLLPFEYDDIQLHGDYLFLQKGDYIEIRDFNFKQIRATYSIYEEGNSVWTDQLFIQKNPKNQKCKLVDKKGNLVLDEHTYIYKPNYSNYKDSVADIAVIYTVDTSKKIYKYGLVNNKGQLILPPTYQSIHYQTLKNDHFVVCLLDQKTQKRTYGLIDRNGNILLEPIYDNLGYFAPHKKFITVQDKTTNKWALMNIDNQELILDNQYDALHYLNHDFVLAIKDNQYGLFNEEGEEVIPIQFNQPDKHHHYNYLKHIHFVGAYTNSSHNNKWGIIDTSGHIIIPFEYDYPLDIVHLPSPTLEGEQTFFKIKDTMSYIGPRNRKQIRLFSGLINSKNQEILAPKFQDISIHEHPSGQHYIMSSDIKKQKYLFDLKGDSITKSPYLSLTQSSTGLFFTQKNYNHFGFGKSLINIEGKELITPYLYGLIEDLDSEHSLFLFKKSRKAPPQEDPLSFGIVNAENEVILEPKYHYISHFQEGLAVVGKRDVELERKLQSSKEIWKYGFINLQGELVIPLVYSNITEHFKNGVAVAVVNGKEKNISKPGQD
ncbi:MAG: WG repeat-containing protein [Saprospiraceae bacterium]|nr:WG repeat-containing protein [Saprospiraceae bacterium]